MWKPCEVIGWKLSGNNYQIDQLTKKHYTVIKCMKELNEALGAGAEEGGGRAMISWVACLHFKMSSCHCFIKNL